MGNLENAKDLGQSIYTKEEVNVNAWTWCSFAKV